MSTHDDKTRAQLRAEQLTTAPDAVPEDAAERIEVSQTEHGVRIDIADGAAVRPGPGPGMPDADQGERA